MIFRVEKNLPFAAGAFALAVAGCAQTPGPPEDVGVTAAEAVIEAEPMPSDDGGAEQAGEAMEVADAADAGNADPDATAADASSTEEAAAASEPPVTQAPAHYQIGSTWTLEFTVEDRVYRSVLTLVDRREFRGRAVNVMAWSEPLSLASVDVCNGQDSVFIDVVTESWVGCVRDGNVLGAHSPHNYRFSWPLYVGRSWQVPSTWTDSAGNTGSPFTVEWEVTAWEEVTVPAGTFMAYRIERADWPSTSWYTPHLMSPIKEVWGGGDSGYPEAMWELVARDLQ